MKESYLIMSEDLKTLASGQKQKRISVVEFLKGTSLNIPDYQRAYSWEWTAKGEDRLGQVNVFVKDLEDALAFGFKNRYYLGNFLFGASRLGDEWRDIIDGQQRLTTTLLFFAAAFRRLGEALPEDFLVIKERIEKRCYRTVSYDQNVFLRCLSMTERLPSADTPFDTQSQKRLVLAARYFDEVLKKREIDSVLNLLNVLGNAGISWLEIERNEDAIQLFLFQNNRGKKPTLLDIVKALFLRSVTSDLGATEDLVARFRTIFEKCTRLEAFVDEDDVLRYAWRIEKNSLQTDFSLQAIEERLRKEGCKFALSFSQKLVEAFNALENFSRESCIEAESLRLMGPYSWSYPFIIKVEQLGIEREQRLQIWRILESLTLRKWALGRRAEIEPRLDEVFKKLTRENAVASLKERHDLLRREEGGWWGYWNDTALKETFEGEFGNHRLACILVWRYQNKKVAQMGYTCVASPDCEHIAPKANPGEGHGYGSYGVAPDDPDGIETGHWLNCLGNYLPLSVHQNRSIQNTDFTEKLAAYDECGQGGEVRKIAETHANGGPLIWDAACIKERTKSIADALSEIYCV